MKIALQFSIKCALCAKNIRVFVMENEKTEIISAKYITAETDHMAYQPGMDNIGSEILDEVI